MKLLHFDDSLIKQRNMDMTAYLQFFFDGGDDVLTIGNKMWLQVPYDCAVKKVRVTTIPAGSITLDVKLSSFGGFDTFNSIANGDYVVLTGGNNVEKIITNMWDNDIAKGQYVRLEVRSVSSIIKCNVMLELEKE